MILFQIQMQGFTASEEMHITQEVVYTLPTDGVVFSTIVGTSNGRIFMGAKDGCLYEFIYQVLNTFSQIQAFVFVALNIKFYRKKLAGGESGAKKSTIQVVLYQY